MTSKEIKNKNVEEQTVDKDGEQLSLREEAKNYAVVLTEEKAETLISSLSKMSLFIGLLEGYVYIFDLEGAVSDNVKDIMNEDSYYEQLLMNVDYKKDKCMSSKTFLSEVRDSILELVDSKFHCVEGLDALLYVLRSKLGCPRSERIYSESFEEVLNELFAKNIKVWGIGSSDEDKESEFDFYSVCMDDDDLTYRLGGSYYHAGEVKE